MTIKAGKLEVWFEYDDNEFRSDQDIIWALESVGIVPTDWTLDAPNLDDFNG